MHAEPYISLVVAARNDNHGENMLGRMQASLDSWIAQAVRYDLHSEIIVVEWNPPPGRHGLKEELRLPEGAGDFPVRFIEVPPEVHQALPHSSAIHLHQMIAKNVGIRRARGQFVLATNIDIIFSAELMQFLAQRRLEQRSFYRMDRFDVASDIPAKAPVDDLLAFCRRNIRRVSAREGTWDTNGEGPRPVALADIISAESGIRLGAGWYGLEAPHGTPERYIEVEAEVIFNRPSGDPPLILDVEVGPSARDGWIELDVLDQEGNELTSATLDGACKLRLKIPEGIESGKIRLHVRNGGVPLLEDARMLDLRVYRIAWGDAGAKAGRSEWKLDVVRRVVTAPRIVQSPHAAQMRNPVYLHTNGCGDFTMLSRDDWFALRGYPEFPIWPQHVDSLLCYAAYHAGMKEVILGAPARIFHIQHLAASGATPEGEEELKARVARKGVPMLDYPTFLKHVHYMRRFNVPLIFSGESWGLGGKDLPESALLWGGPPGPRPTPSSAS